MKVTCEHDGIVFDTPWTGARGGKRKSRFCSIACSRAAQAALYPACEFCGSTFRSRKTTKVLRTRFCSIRCMAEARRRFTPDEVRERARIRAREAYWRDVVCLGANEYVRVRELPEEWRPVAHAIQETRLALGRARIANRSTTA